MDNRDPAITTLLAQRERHQRSVRRRKIEARAILDLIDEKNPVGSYGPALAAIAADLVGAISSLEATDDALRALGVTP